MAKNGVSHRKTGPFPAKADPVAQQPFLDTRFTFGLDEAQAGQRHVGFVGAAPFVLGARLSYSLVPASTLSCLGHVHDVITVANDTYSHSLRVVTLLEKLAARSADLPITMIFDNARHQRNASTSPGSGCPRIPPILTSLTAWGSLSKPNAFMAAAIRNLFHSSKPSLSVGRRSAVVTKTHSVPS